MAKKKNDEKEEYRPGYFLDQRREVINHLGLTPYAVALFGQIVHWESLTGWCKAITATLASGANMSAGTGHKAKHELIDAGVIRVHHKELGSISGHPKDVLVTYLSDDDMFEKLLKKINEPVE